MEGFSPGDPVNLLLLVSFASADPTPFERWSARHPVEWMASHRVEQGETAWELSQAVGVPVPVLRELTTLDLDPLHPGDWISFPVTEQNRATALQWHTEEECGC